MPTVLITGTSRGIGLEFVKQYAAEGWKVIAVARNPGSDDRLGEVSGEVSIHLLDVTDAAAVASFSETIKDQPIDVLINNAGINGNRMKKFGNTDYEAWEDMLRVNTLAPLRMTEALISNILQSNMRTVACISSVIGSIGRNSTGGRYDYRSSKAALNAVIASMALDLAEQDVKVLALHPGWVQTERNGPEAPIPLDVSIAGMRKLIDDATAETSGKYLNFRGEEYDW
ncbi:MAG: SDR family oxidoreductase [Rhodospirillaceae bacterium]|jgi:NAD(P)-dependent dehydrogenase (short-subunit alcohol dehydrogenase family)|nr:SDR family oxidoreductase [Rhodospirillaceae bacterium]MBT5940571.1 SDR family oxidoreductase [Rhodospirillaceae bacterium]MBT7267835.1 SDR family oxidoreductase [Rhodospirillaceae bacterium]